jgi:molybdopterin converting factor small subunit
MGVRVKMHQTLRHLTNGQATAEVHGTTVGECLHDLVKQFPGMEKRLFDKKGRLLNYVDIYVNLESSYPEELAMPVKDGDELSITLMIAGG